MAAVDTAGRAVLFAGITVIISLMGMLLLGLPFLYGVATAAAIAVLFTMIAALTGKVTYIGSWLTIVASAPRRPSWRKRTISSKRSIKSLDSISSLRPAKRGVNATGAGT